MGLLDLFNDPYQPSASSATAGLLSPQDKLMALFQGLSSAGAHMAQPGLGRGQALAMGLGGFGQGMAQGNQQAMVQKMMAGKLAEEQRKLAAQGVLDKAYSGGDPTPGPSVASMSGMPVAQAMAGRIGTAKEDALSKPEVQQALLSLYGPQGLAALQNAQKAPETVEGFDPQTGQPARFMFNRQTGRYDTVVGGSKVDPMQPVRGPDGNYSFLPGVVPALAGKEGAVKGAEAAATLPYEYPRAFAQAAGAAPFKTVSFTAGGGVVTPFASMGPPFGLPGIPGMPPRAAQQPPTTAPGGSGLPVTGGNPPAPQDPRVIYKDPTVGTQPSDIEKYLGERFVETQKAGIAARGKDQNLARLADLLDQAYTGTGADTVLAAQRAAKSLGLDLGNPGPGEAANALSREMALQLRNPAGGAGMPGAMSDADRNYLTSMTPTIANTKEGRDLMVESMKRLNKRDQEVADFARQYARDHGGRLDLNFEDEVAKKFGGKDLFADLAKKTPAIPAPASDPLADARAAISKGAPRAKVIERLKAAGVDTTGL